MRYFSMVYYSWSWPINICDIRTDKSNNSNAKLQLYIFQDIHIFREVQIVFRKFCPTKQTMDLNEKKKRSDYEIMRLQIKL